MKLRWTLLSLVPITALVAHCGSTTPDIPSPDAGDDASTQPDSSMKDAGAKDTGVNDTGAQDASADAQGDAPLDSPTDTGPDVLMGDASFDPGGLSGLVLWLDAAKANSSGKALTTWPDRSSKKNDAAAGTLGADGGTGTAPTVVPSSINALPAVRFTAAQATYAVVKDAASLQFGTGDYYIAVVAKFDNDPTSTTPIGCFFCKADMSSGVIFTGNDIAPMMSMPAAGLTWAENAMTFLNAKGTYNDGTARLYEVQRVSGALTMSVAAASVATGTDSSVDVSAAANDVFIGSFVQGGAPSPGLTLDGDIAEIIAVTGTLGSSDVLGVEAYLKAKYAL